MPGNVLLIKNKNYEIVGKVLTISLLNTSYTGEISSFLVSFSHTELRLVSTTEVHPSLYTYDLCYIDVSRGWDSRRVRSTCRE